MQFRSHYYLGLWNISGYYQGLWNLSYTFIRGLKVSTFKVYYSIDWTYLTNLTHFPLRTLPNISTYNDSYIPFIDDVVYNQSVAPTGTMDKRRPDLRDELGYIAPPNRKLPPVPGSNYNTCDRIKRGTNISKVL